MFLFKYPKQKYEKEVQLLKLTVSNPEADPEEIEVMLEKQIES